jgi:hypothetical protein
MALDRTLALLRGNTARQSVGRVAAELRRIDPADVPRMCRVGPDLRLYLPSAPAGRIAGLAAELESGRRNPYEVLDDHGILVISSPEDGDRVALSGGSHCAVVIQSDGDELLVTKRVTKQDGAASTDGWRRHRNEAEWLAVASRLCSLFPPLAAVSENAGSYAFATQFFPAYSVAELVLQGRLSGPELADVLITVYDRLTTELYSHQPIRTAWRDPDGDYLRKIRRRTALLLDAPLPTALVALIRAKTVRVNGRICPSLAALLATIRVDPFWRPLRSPAGRHACHGDLILEDILLRPGRQREIRLIDPNPYNQHGLFDLAKTMLSLWIGYEFVYFDLFGVQTKVTADEVAVEVTLDVTDHGDHYATAAAEFMRYATRELSCVLGLPSAPFVRLVHMAAALTALAIPAFHAIRHRRPDRATAYLALGLLHASHALAGDPPPHLPSA